MPKTPSNRLFNLIKSLSGSEKRYFKLFIKNDGDSKYFQLFNAVDQQVEFDEQALIKAIYGDQLIQSRKYSELKAYLYDLILKSLQQYDESTSIEYPLKGMLLSVQTLYKRSLFQDCTHLLKKAKKLAFKYERFTALLEILNWEKHIAYANSDVLYFDTYLQQLKTEEDRCLQSIQNLKTYQRLFFEMYVLVRKNTSKKDALHQQVEKIKNHPLLTSEKEIFSHQARVFYFRTHALLTYYFKDAQLFYENSKKVILLLEEHPAILKEDVSQYISALSNFTISCGYLKKYEEVRETLRKLRKIQANTQDDILKIHQLYYNNYFSMCIKTGAFEEGFKVLEQHVSDTKKQSRTLFLNNFHFQYFYIYFGLEKYDKALDYLNQWLDLPKSVEQQDLQSLARLLNLVVHFELKHYILLDSLLRSTQRLLRKRKRFFPFEQLLLQAIRQAIRLQGNREIRSWFDEVKTRMSQLTFNEEETNLLRFFDFHAWVESKRTGRPFAVIIQENYR